MKNKDFGSEFLTKAVALNIRKFGDLRERFYAMLGLRRREAGRAVLESQADIRALSKILNTENPLSLVSGRTQSFRTVDSIAAGINKLGNGGIKQFLERSANRHHAIDIQDL